MNAATLPPSWVFHAARYPSTHSAAMASPPVVVDGIPQGIGIGVMPTLAIRAVARPCTLKFGWDRFSTLVPDSLGRLPSPPTPPRCWPSAARIQPATALAPLPVASAR